jgi:2-methylcitrate dehydratase PrpD
VKPEHLLDGWGRDWRTAEYRLKPYFGCRCNHTAIGLGIRLHQDGVRAEDLTNIEIGLGKLNSLTVGQPYDPSLQFIVHAQFNVSYSFARALIDGKVDLATYEPSAIGDARVAALTSLSCVVDDPGIDPQAIAPARITLQLKSDASIEVSSTTVKTSPADSMSDEEVQAKLRGCLSFGLRASEDQTERLIDAVRTLDRAPDAAHALVGAFPSNVG